MQEHVSPPPLLPLPLLPYHAAVRDFLTRTDPEVWEWFASRRLSPKYAEDVRFDLLKSTYRIERDSARSLYEAADEVAAKLGVSAALTMYQAQNPAGLNASLAYVPGEVHLVLHGPIAAQLTAAEVRALLGHELGHYQLLDGWGGEMLVASEVLGALVNDPHSHPAQVASWRLFRLYTEIFCDRVALAVTRDLAAIVSTLVKVETGVQEISPEAYLRQADEIFAREQVLTDGVSHPETFIRARAARLWHEGRAEADGLIARMIEGEPALDQVDLLEQERIQTATRRVLDALLCHKWFQTDVVVAQARLYFEEYVPPAEPLEDTELPRVARVQPDSLRDYFCYLLLDFVTADRELDEPPLAAALVLAERMAIKPRLMELVRQELKLRKNQLDRVDRDKDKILADANRQEVAR